MNADIEGDIQLSHVDAGNTLEDGKKTKTATTTKNKTKGIRVSGPSPKAEQPKFPRLPAAGFLYKRKITHLV